MTKTLVSTLLVALVISGCGSSDSDDSSGGSSSIAVWDYIVSDTSAILSFDSIKIEDSVVTSTAIGNYTHEYTVVNDTEVKGSFRDYEGEYLFKLGGYVTYGAADENLTSYASGGITPQRDIGDYVYPSYGSTGFSSTSFGVVSSLYRSGKDCLISKIHDSITLYDGYSYSNVMEVTCEDELTQEYGEVGSSLEIKGIDRYKEYYQKGTGWIAKVNSNCIVSIANNNYEFMDDDNTTCVKSTTEYELANINL